MTRTALPPLTLYVHLPWCERKCPYCDFNSFERRGQLAEQQYVDALLRDLDLDSTQTGGRALSSIYFGGGTPSLFSGTAIGHLLDGITARLTLADDAELTLEANPGAVDAARFAAYRAAGVNRLSIGAQSFRRAQLAALGRIHDGDDVARAVTLARTAGFDNFNLDLMYGLPGDDEAGAMADLEHALDLAPTHLSWYQLTLEPNTAFHRRPPALPDDDVVAAIETAGRHRLAAHGYERYEVSAYARGGCRSLHNVNYWEFGDYLGIGAGAHGKLTRFEPLRIERRARPRNPLSFMSRAGDPAAVTVETVGDPHGLALEFLLNALRLTGGVPLALFGERTGLEIVQIAEPLAAARDKGWLVADPERLSTTPVGLNQLNRVLELFA